MLHILNNPLESQIISPCRRKNKKGTCPVLILATWRHTTESVGVSWLFKNGFARDWGSLFIDIFYRKCMIRGSARLQLQLTPLTAGDFAIYVNPLVRFWKWNLFINRYRPFALIYGLLTLKEPPFKLTLLLFFITLFLFCVISWHFDECEKQFLKIRWLLFLANALF